jgi:hypothetical protein
MGLEELHELGILLVKFRFKGFKSILVHWYLLCVGRLYLCSEEDRKARLKRGGAEQGRGFDRLTAGRERRGANTQAPKYPRGRR